jgi:dihydroorotate dehydrogenase (fumarate)
MNLNVTYMGLELSSPIVVSSSPFTSSLGGIISAAQAGAGAVVLKTVFEEQASLDAESLTQESPHTEASDYLSHYIADDLRAHTLQLVERVKQRVDIPIIASLNTSSATQIAPFVASLIAAGIDALELNLSTTPLTGDQTSERIESRHLDTVARVAKMSSVPLSVKLPAEFTSVVSMCRHLYDRGAAGVVLYNHPHQPDIDIERITYTPSEGWSTGHELRSVLYGVAFASGSVPQMDFALSGGVHSGADAVKAVLAGASAVYVCSTIHHNGFGVIGSINNFLGEWCYRHNFERLALARGLLSTASATPENTALLYRNQYLRHG